MPQESLPGMTGEDLSSTKRACKDRGSFFKKMQKSQQRQKIMHMKKQGNTAQRNKSP